jgi:hypothetical protein
LGCAVGTSAILKNDPVNVPRRLCFPGIAKLLRIWAFSDDNIDDLLRSLEDALGEGFLSGGINCERLKLFDGADVDPDLEGLCTGAPDGSESDDTPECCGVNEAPPDNAGGNADGDGDGDSSGTTFGEPRSDSSITKEIAAAGIAKV